MIAIQIICLVAICFGVSEVRGHGMLLDPPGRSSRWRYDATAPVNYDDNALYCGGFYIHHSLNGGKCGTCGDDYRMPVPRPNELGGTYGQGTIVHHYVNNVINVGSQITANHLGYIKYELCNLDVAGAESEDCFQSLIFADGSDKFYIGSYIGSINSDIVIPSGTKCKHCILRWTYTAGNNWGFCPDGSGAVGCGAQETFKSCADISLSVN